MVFTNKFALFINLIIKKEMVTVTKKEFAGFVQDIAGQFGVNNAVAIAFDDEFARISYAILEDNSIVDLPIKVFNALYYNKGNNAIISIKKNAIVIDFINKMAKIVPTKWVKRK